MVQLCGARMVPGTIDAYPSPAQPRMVDLRLARIEGLLGQSIEETEVTRILERLGFATTSGTPGVLHTEVPPWRDMDVQREADLIEEVARIYGLDRLPTTLPARRRAVGRLTPAQRLRRRLEDALRDRGLDEVVSWSFIAPESLQRLRLGQAEQLRLANPLSEDQSVMRPVLLPGLLDAARYNATHGVSDLALFESAHVYLPGDGLGAPDGSPRGATPARERHHIGALLTTAVPGTWRREPVGADFFAARALVEALLGAAELNFKVERASQPFLHPGRAGRLMVDEDEIGWIGELHPLVARDWDLDGASVFELDAESLAEKAGHVHAFEDVTTFPAVLQDIAVVSPLDVDAASVEAAVRAGGGELLRDVRVFDVYTGEQVGKGNWSLALRLEFRAPDRTLTDDEVAESRATIEAALAELGGRLRA
jgi:phenylalanyl-tRNA synthetase beta chain